MPNKDIFCQVPWTNLHIYWDGGYGGCCFEQKRLYPDSDWKVHNIKNYTVKEWFNTEYMKKFRKDIMGSTPLEECGHCYHDEKHGFLGKRVKENLKTVIFTNSKEIFEKSYQQSKWHDRFESARKDADLDPPIDWHVDLGNECNLACKFCNPKASSKILSVYKKWQLPVEYRQNWTVSDSAWQNFLTSIDETPKLKRIHFMGGEPVISKRLPQLLDYLIDKNRTDISISFVTNGTVYDQSIVDKLNKFSRVDIEISIESVEINNDYIRQGSSYQSTIDNILLYNKNSNSNFQVVLRSVPQLFNAYNYYKLIKFAFDHKIIINSIPLKDPHYLSIPVLPKNLRNDLIENYVNLKNFLETENTSSSLNNGRNDKELVNILLQETNAMIKILNVNELENTETVYKELLYWIKKWDVEYRLNVTDIFPIAYIDFLKEIGYENI